MYARAARASLRGADTCACRARALSLCAGWCQLERQSAALFGRAREGRLLLDTCVWLLHVAVFAAQEPLRDKALIGLLLLIADSVREHRTVAPMTVLLTLAVHRLLKRPTAPTAFVNNSHV
eukprot:jgi/Mesen1/10042/ME000073S09325